MQGEKSGNTCWPTDRGWPEKGSVALVREEQDGGLPDMRLTETISASDYPLSGADRQSYGEKPHSDFTKRPFQTLIHDLASFPHPEMTLFSNNPVADIQKDGLEAVPGGSRTGVPWGRCEQFPAGDTRWPPLSEPVSVKADSRKVHGKEADPV